MHKEAIYDSWKILSHWYDWLFWRIRNMKVITQIVNIVKNWLKKILLCDQYMFIYT